MAVQKIATISKWIGLSTDVKPENVPVGSEFWEYDTGSTYITYDGTEWVSKANEIIDYEDRLVDDQGLTTDGIQYSDAVDTTTVSEAVVVFSKTIDPGIDSKPGNVLWIEWGLRAQFRAVSSITADLTWQWQARNQYGVWDNLHDAVTEAAIGTSYVERQRQGYFKSALLDQVPFEVQLLIYCNETNQGRGRVKSSSYVRVIYEAA